mmetsp:Transcript_68565/g.190836  ORF Transcript_68565/g.190836 Transcript_68565/m.190836 type:complete len:299 (+) Transcript_68565:132-1028(+)
MRVTSRAQRRENKHRDWIRKRLVRSSIVAALARKARSQQDWLAAAWRRWVKGTREVARSLHALASQMERGRLLTQNHRAMLGRGWRALCRSAESHAHKEQSRTRWLDMIKLTTTKLDKLLTGDQLRYGWRKLVECAHNERYKDARVTGDDIMRKYQASVLHKAIAGPGPSRRRVMMRAWFRLKECAYEAESMNIRHLSQVVRVEVELKSTVSARLRLIVELPSPPQLSSTFVFYTDELRISVLVQVLALLGDYDSQPYLTISMYHSFLRICMVSFSMRLRSLSRRQHFKTHRCICRRS